jgi:phenylacetate-coenzyme A ligase PaaK-like adenylate-forming protein
MERFQPDSLFGYTSGVGLLAKEQIAGNINIAPKKIWCGGDPLTPAIRTNIEKAFGVNPINMYAASETMSFAIECNARHRLHLFDDWFSVQVVDDDLKCVRSGLPGRVIITNLYNYTQPLIRYQLDDEIVLSDEPCQCGWPFPVIEKIAGRHEEFLWFTKTDRSREFIHPIVLVEFFVPGLEKYQFVQSSPNRLLMKAVIKGEKDSIIPKIHKIMSEIFSQKSLEDNVQFDIELIDEIKNDPKTGKFRFIIPFAKI